MQWLLDIIGGVVFSFLNLLPVSPLKVMLGYVTDIDILGYINYFIPFDVCSMIMEVWLVAVTAVMIAKNMDKIMKLIGTLKGLL